MHLVADLYPRLAPLTGGRLVRFSQLKAGSFFRRVTHGTGFGLIVLPGDAEDAQHLDPRGLQFIRWLDLDLLPLVEVALSSAADDIVDTATPHGLAVNNRVEFAELTGGAGLATTAVYYVRSVPGPNSFTLAATRGGAQVGFTSNITAGTVRKLRSIGGNWITGGDFEALSERGTRDLALGGAGTLAYVQRAAMLAHTYLPWGKHPFDDMWRYQNQSTIFAGGARLGSYWWRTLSELTAPTRGSLEDGTGGATFHEVPDLTFDFTGFVDSAGAAWPAYPGEFTVQVGEDDGLSVGERLVRLGLITDLDADDFVMRSWVASGRDLSGVAWAPDVVRFQVPTDGTQATGNILNDAGRAIAVAAKRKRLLVGSEDAWRIVTDPAVDIEWTGGLRVDPGDAAALDVAGQAQLRARLDAGDVPKIRIPLGNDPVNGLYTPGPLDLAGAHLWDNDIVTLHSGEGAWDWDEVDVRVAAIEWRLADRKPGDNADIFIEGGSTFMPFDQRFEANPGSATRNQPHGPHIRLCVPGAADTVLYGPLEWAGGVAHSVAIWPSGTGTWPVSGNASAVAGWDGASGCVECGSAFSGDTSSGPLPATPGVAYRWTAWATQNTTTNQLRVRFFDAASVQLADYLLAQPTGSWAEYTISPVAPANTAFMRMDVITSALTRLWYDRVSVTAEGSGAVNDGHPDLVGSDSRASRCGHKHHVLRTTAPTVNDDWATAGYPTTTRWSQVDDIDNPTTIVSTWVLVDASTGAAVWVEEGGGLSEAEVDAIVAAAIADHAATADPHAGYQKESEKGVAGGYAGLDAGAKVPTAQLGSGTASSSTFLRGDLSWAAAPAPTIAQVRDAGHWSPLTNGNSASPELIFDGNGDVILVWETG